MNFRNDVPPVPYVYQPYPKALNVPGTPGVQIVVQNEDEHLAQLEAWGVFAPQKAPVPPAVNPLLDPQSPREKLLAKAEKLGVKVDGRWSDNRLAEVVEHAQQ